jgi:hypothetical protein
MIAAADDPIRPRVLASARDNRNGLGPQLVALGIVILAILRRQVPCHATLGGACRLDSPSPSSARKACPYPEAQLERSSSPRGEALL